LDIKKGKEKLQQVKEETLERTDQLNQVIKSSQPLHKGYHNLKKKLHPSSFSPQFRIKIALDIASAIHYLHSFQPPLVHNDIRSPNIFVTFRFIFLLLPCFFKLEVSEEDLNNNGEQPRRIIGAKVLFFFMILQQWVLIFSLQTI